MRGHNGRFVCHAAAIMAVLFAMRMPKLSRLAGGRAPKGRRGSHAHGNNTGRIHGQHKRVRKSGKSLLCMGNPSGPAGHLPCKAEEFYLRTNKLFAAIDFKSVVAYQRGSMKTFFPTEFRLRRETPQARWASSPTRRNSSFSQVLLHPQRRKRPGKRLAVCGHPHNI